VVTGEFHHITKARLIEILKENGGRVVGTVSGKTSYVLEGTKPKKGKTYEQPA
jgi:NAD-dependent DNA ligase